MKKLILVLLLFTSVLKAQKSDVKIYKVTHEVLLENEKLQKKKKCNCEVQIYSDEIRLVKLNTLKTVVIFPAKNGIKENNKFYTSYVTSVQVGKKVFTSEVRFLKETNGVIIMSKDGSGYGMVNLK